MDIDTIRYILEVEKTGSIGIAAKNLFQSAPTISNSIKSLESQLGGELFKRSNKGMILTEMGRQFVGYARPFYRQYEYLEQITDSLSPQRPSLYIASSPQKTASNIFVQMCSEYAKYECNFSFNELSVEDILEQVSNRTADLGLIIFVSHWKKSIMRLIKMKNLEYSTLNEEHPQVIVRTGHPLCRQKNEYITFEQLEKYPYVTSYVGAFQYIAEEYDSNVAYLGKKGKFVVHNRASMYDVIHNTDAYSISSNNRLAYAGKSFDDGIATFPLQPVNFNLELGWVKPAATELSDIGNEFIQRLKASLTDYQNKKPNP